MRPHPLIEARYMQAELLRMPAQILKRKLLIARSSAPRSDLADGVGVHREGDDMRPGGALPDPLDHPQATRVGKHQIHNAHVRQQPGH